MVGQQAEGIAHLPTFLNSIGLVSGRHRSESTQTQGSRKNLTFEGDAEAEEKQRSQPPSRRKLNGNRGAG